MKALTVVPLQAGTAALSEMPEPPETDGPVLVETLAVGVCGTDIEIVSGEYGWAPPGEERLVIGHESLGRVLEAPAGAPVTEGDLVVGIVRRPDPVPCPSCSVLEWDFCRNGQYTERGIKELHGYCSERYRITPDFAVKVDPDLGLLGVLLEPTSVVAKAWEQVDLVGGRLHWEPETVLVTGRGPHRAAGGADRGAARARGTRARPGDRGSEARSGAQPRSELPHRHSWPRRARIRTS